jgi:predicted ATPase/class 3 adenylate cyclase
MSDAVGLRVFVMTDVVGSTALWEEFGDSMRESLELHDRLVGDAMVGVGGRVFKHTGDGMIAVFDGADAGVAGALRAVADLEAARWGESGPLKIRVSVHAGEAVERDGDFFGRSLNKTARINAIGHGGQVLVSDAARILMGEPAGIDLGEHQLRDLSEPIRLWQVDAGEHPRLRTLDSARHNLPRMPTEFLGRQSEIDELRQLLDRHSLVTITGVGGCGKTRLAIEAAAAVADSFPGGVWFADLTQERDGSAVGDRALAALGLAEPVSATPAGAAASLAEATRETPTLVVIDNCEHLIDDVADFAEDVLAKATAVTVLATSREPLSIPGERVWRIPNLHDGAVELFLDRAAAAGVTDLDEQLDEVAEICARLDNIPLAVELAASQVRSMSIAQLADGLDDRFSLLSGGRRAGRRRQRQQTLQTMMDWSYGLLSTEEKTLFHELAVFAGSFPPAGVEAVATPATEPVLARLQALVDQSLVVPLRDSGRFRLLETVRLYALDRLLESGDADVLRDRHSSWVSASIGADRLERLTDDESLQHVHAVRADIDNALAAMEWAEDTGDDDSLLNVFLGCNAVWLSDSAYGRIGLGWLDRIPVPPDEEPVARAQWLANAGLIQFNMGDLTAAFETFMEGSRFVDEAIVLGSAGCALWSPIVHFRANVHAAMGDYDAALADADLLAELATTAGPPWTMRWMSWHVRADVYSRQGDPRALEAAERAVESAEGMSDFASAIAHFPLSLELVHVGRFEDSLAAARVCLEAPAISEVIRTFSLAVAAQACSALHRFDQAIDVIETDFGPMLDTQRAALLSSRLTGVAAILVALDKRDDLPRLAGLAMHLGDHHALEPHRRFWAAAIGGEPALAALSEPTAHDLDLDRVATVLRETTEKIRTLLAVS